MSQCGSLNVAVIGAKVFLVLPSLETHGQHLLVLASKTVHFVWHGLMG